MAIEVDYFELPTHWAPILINGDEGGLEEEDSQALDNFVDWMVETYGKCWCLDVENDTYFSKYHDAHHLGVGACDVSLFTFDVTKNG